MSDAAGFAAPPPEISTQAELDGLTAARPEPAPEQHLTPDGPDTMEVRSQVDAASDERIDFLEERLSQVRETVYHEHYLANLRGQATFDFGHSR